MKLKCPYCNKNNCISDVAYYNADTYLLGGNKTDREQSYHSRCLHCDKVIEVNIVRELKIVSIKKTERDEQERRDALNVKDWQKRIRISERIIAKRNTKVKLWLGWRNVNA